MATKREYVARHVYKTPTGLYYDDRTSKRLTGKRGQASEKAAERMKARVRDESGKLSYKTITVTTDGRPQGTHTPKYYKRSAEVSVSYDEEIDESLALANARTHLDEDEEGIVHFNLSLGEEEYT